MAGTGSATLRRAFGSVAELFKTRSRRVAVGSERAHVEFRETAVGEIQALVAALRRVSTSLGQLTSVEINAATQRVVFAFERGAYGADELCEAVEAAEQEAGVGAARFAEERPWHPADENEALRRFVELMADTAAFVLGLGFRLSPFPAMPFAGNLVALLSLMHSVPRLRQGLERRLGKERAGFVLNMATSLAQGLAQRPFNSFVDALHKLSLLGEVRSQREVWAEREEELCRPVSPPSA
jgi:hypothetical protein